MAEILTREEMEAINNAQPATAKYGDVFAAIAQAQLAKDRVEIRRETLKEVGEWLERHIIGLLPEKEIFPLKVKGIEIFRLKYDGELSE